MITFEEYYGVGHSMSMAVDPKDAWNAAVEASAGVCEQFGKTLEVNVGDCFAEAVRELRSVVDEAAESNPAAAMQAIFIAQFGAEYMG